MPGTNIPSNQYVFIQIFLFGGSTFSFLELGAAMMEMISRDAIALTLGAPPLDFVHKFSAIFFCVSTK